MTTIHFVYPHGPSISCPDAIGRHLGERLGRHFPVRQYDWDETGVLNPGRDDVLLGHPHLAPWTIFRRSASKMGWRRIIAMSPFNHDAKQVSFLDHVIATHCDLYLAITGNFWFDSLQDSLFAHWAPKTVHVDLAVDRTEFPVIKTRFNPPHTRRFLYIGYLGWPKNTAYLNELAGMLPGQISWMGEGGKGDSQNLTPLGYQDFASRHARQLVATHDFLITVGAADSNPATILEAMAWGLVPVCTPTSGYVGYPGIRNIPLDDPGEAANRLRALQTLPESHLADMQAANWQALDSHFNWERFAGQVLDSIRSDERPPVGEEGLARKARLRASSLASPHSMLRRQNLRLLTRRWSRERGALPDVPDSPTGESSRL